MLQYSKSSNVLSNNIAFIADLVNHCYLIAVGYRPGRSSGYRDWSILRLSVEVPYGLKATITPCSSNCVKDLKKPNEFKLSYGFSEIVGKLSVGFGKKNYEILALSRTIFSASVGKR